MIYNIIGHPNFIKELKSIAKKHLSIKSDIDNFIKNIDKELLLADDLGDGFKKIRLKISNNKKGASKGARIITYETIVSINQKNLILASIYLKSDYSSINLKILKEILEIE